ncbi:MAG: TonB-dependent siderophore receptor [Burkholderiaceae bacterium]
MTTASLAHRAFWLSFGAALACPPAALAQTTAAAATAAADPAPAGSLQRIVVTGQADKQEADTGYRAGGSDTATGLGLTLRETPQAITVITRAQMDDFKLHSVNDVLAAAPGVIVEKVETDRTYYTARGFDVTNFQIDGIGMPFTNGAQWGDVDAWVYERVDVLRGANGLGSGTGYPSATINYVRKKPTADFQAAAGLSLGSWDDRRVQADVSGALNDSGSVRGRVVAATQKRDSYLDRYAADKSVVYAALDVDLGPATLLSFSHTSQWSNADSPMWGALPLVYSDGTPTDYDVSTSTAADWAWWDNADHRTHVELSHDFGNDWQARAVLTRREMATDSELFYVYGTPDKATGLGLYSYPSAFSGDYAQTLLNLQLSGRFPLAGRRHDLVLGASWAREQANEFSGYGNDIGTPLPDLATWDGHYPKPAFDTSFNGSDFDSHRRTVSAAVRWSLADTLKLITGLNAVGVRSSGSNYGVDHRYAHDQLVPYLGAVWDLARDLSLYGSATRIFNPQTETDQPGRVLDPVQGRNIELGLKGQLADQRLGYGVAVFHTRQDNLAAFAGYRDDFSAYYAGEDAISRGVELELNGQLAPAVEISASLTHLRLTTPDGDDARTWVPRSTARLMARWKPTPELSLGGQLRWQSEIHRSAAVRQGAYAVVDLMASYAFDEHWSASLNLRNVGNEKYLGSLYWDQAYYGAPRNGSVSVDWKF